MAKKSSNNARYLAHPVYLDVPMMISFLATIDNGVAYTSEVAETLASSNEGEGEGSARAGVPSLAQWLGLTLNAEGKYKRRSTKEETVEAKIVREHTSASLFNVLRRYLLDAETVKSARSDEELSSLQVGDLVESRGTINGDPLRRAMALFSAIAPYMGIDLDADPKSSRAPVTAGRKSSGSKDGKAAGLDEDQWQMFKILKADLSKSRVLDLTMALDGGRQAVLTASNDFMTDAAEEYLLAGSFTVLGKVTQVLSDGESVSMLRRTVFGVMEASGTSAAHEAFSGLANAMPGLDFSNLAVRGPALQILPLAIYV